MFWIGCLRCQPPEGPDEEEDPEDPCAPSTSSPPPSAPSIHVTHACLIVRKKRRAPIQYILECFQGTAALPPQLCPRVCGCGRRGSPGLFREGQHSGHRGGKRITSIQDIPDCSLGTVLHFLPAGAPGRSMCSNDCEVLLVARAFCKTAVSAANLKKNEYGAGVYFARHRRRS